MVQSIQLPTPHNTALRRVFAVWWPLAASWMLMGLELPAISAVIARLAEPEINLAAYGGVVFPISLIVEAPIIMLLAASTALSRDWASYVRVRRFMMRTSAVLTVLHVLVAFTPLYYFIVEQVIGAPAEIVEPARIGLMIMTPWTWAIAYRRFNQGVLIRFEHSASVGVGTVIRLTGNFLTLLIGYSLSEVFEVMTLPGIVVGPAAVIVGVLSEAFYVGMRVRPVLRDELRPMPPVQPPLTFDAFLAFYIPLALTSLLQLLFQPFGSAAMSRMPMPLESLAIWPVVGGLSFLLRSAGVAYNEVVVALIDEPGMLRPLRRFSSLLALALTLIQLAIGATPLAILWFRDLSGLSPQLATMARTAVMLGLPLPALSVLVSWYQGALVNSRQTRGIPESMGLFLAMILVTLAIGVRLASTNGANVTIVALTLGFSIQALWLWVRTRSPIRALMASQAQAGSQAV